MDINDLRSIVTVVSFAMFLGIVWWAYSRGSKQRFDEAANLPFAEDEGERVHAGPVRHEKRKTS
ncbi:MAG: cbb3-type cytochrome c oxidase subunit 3 [Betaproteobacteria bacterium]|nr:cbb3-type cytochrome c oxidase subunit 3 [Betaproteobacteria bacterium]